LELERFNDPTLDLYATSIYEQSKANDLPLVSYDTALLHRFVNTFISIQGEYRIRALREMPSIIQDAEELVTILKDEYPE